MPPFKEKRTKEQVLQLLGRAMEQEESLLIKIQNLEAELSDCRKKVENPRHELEEQALSKSKVSFRLDYYRMEEKGPLKGIIEHLPSRESWSFEGDRLEEIGDFIAQFVGASVWTVPVIDTSSNSNTTSSAPLETIEPSMEAGKKKKRATSVAKSAAKSFIEPAAAHAVEQLDSAETLTDESFLILTNGAKEHQRAVTRNQAFQIAIPKQHLEALQGMRSCLKVSAAASDKQLQDVFVWWEYCTPGPNALWVTIPAHPLKSGVYRLTVSIGIRAEPQKIYYKETRLLIVP